MEAVQVEHVTKRYLVLADEPTANLDTANGQQVMEIMARLNRETGTAFVYATHDPRVIAFARRVVTLVDGRISSDTAHPTAPEPHRETPLAQPT